MINKYMLVLSNPDTLIGGASVDLITVILCLGIAISREIRAWYKVFTRKKK